MTITTKTFQGDANGGIPPDSQIAAGISYIVETTNSNLNIYDKQGNLISSISPIWNLFTGISPTLTITDFRIIYDYNHSRYIVCCGGNYLTTTPCIFISISSSSDPSQQWYSWKIITGTSFIDYPEMGIDQNNLYITANGTPPNTPTKINVVCVIPIQQLLTGTTNITYNLDTSSSYNVEPAKTFGNPGVEYGIDIQFNIYSIGTDAIITNLGKIQVIEPVSKGGNAPQLGTTQKISISTYVDVVYRNGYLWACLSNGNQIGWYQIDPIQMNIIQQGTINDLNMWYIIPSIAVNKNNDIAIGFSGTSSSTYIGSYCTGRSSSDTPGTMQDVVQLQSGDSTYTKSNRWGDVSATVVDPVDDITFWTVQEYAGQGDGKTSISELLITPIPTPTCTSLSVAPYVENHFIGETITFDITAEPLNTSYPVDLRDQNNNLLGKCTTSGGTCTIGWDTTNMVTGTYILIANVPDQTLCTSPQMIIALSAPCSDITLSVNKANAYVGERLIFTIVTQPSTQSYNVELNLPNQSPPYNSCTTSGGTCTFEWNTDGSTPGIYAIVASVGQCTSTPLSITLKQQCTSVSITTDKTSASLGEMVTFYVTVVPISQPYPIQILDQNNNLWGSCMTSEGTCSIGWDTTGLNTGTYTMIARVMLGDSLLCPQSNPIDIYLTPACTSIRISADKSSIYVGDIVTLTVEIQPSTQLYIVGFKDQNNNVLGSCTTSNGTCSFVWNPGTLSSGIYTITAYVLGSPQCNASKQITIMSTCVLVNMTPSKTIATIGESITINLNVNPISQPFNVQLKDQNNNVIGNCSTTNGNCSVSWNTSGLLATSYIITARVVDGEAGQCISMPVTIILQNQTNWLGIGSIAMLGLAGTILYLYKK